MEQEHEDWLKSQLGPKIDRALDRPDVPEPLLRRGIRSFSRGGDAELDGPPDTVVVSFGFANHPLFELELELPLMAFARLTAEDLSRLLRSEVLDEEPLFMAADDRAELNALSPLNFEARRKILDASHRSIRELLGEGDKAPELSDRLVPLVIRGGPGNLGELERVLTSQVTAIRGRARLLRPGRRVPR